MNAFGDAWGDRSFTWRLPGWSRLDVLSRSVPAVLSTRLPLVARVLADAAYLRASFGILWLLLPIGGVALGVSAALGGSGAPLPPALLLTASLLVLAILDSTTGVAAVLAFAATTIARGGLTEEGLGLGQGVHGLLGLGALWFVTPLIAAAARPLRRLSSPGTSMPGTGSATPSSPLCSVGGPCRAWWEDSETSRGAPCRSPSMRIGLALLAIAAVMARFAMEELAATGYPRRLAAVEAARTGEPAAFHHLRGLVVRSALLAFFAGAFLGNCWQLWAGVAIFALPQLLALVGDRIPDFERVAPAVPRGVTQVLVLVLVGPPSPICWPPGEATAAMRTSRSSEPDSCCLPSRPRPSSCSPCSVETNPPGAGRGGASSPVPGWSWRPSSW